MRYSHLLSISFLSIAIGCSDTSTKSPIMPTTVLTEEQLVQIQNEDDRVAFEESQGSIRPVGQ